MAKQIYDYWFVQFDFPDENGKPYKSSGGKMVWNEDLKREIPEDWEVKRLENVIKVNRGGSPRPIDEFLSDIGLHWLKISDATVSSSPFILDTKEFIILVARQVARLDRSRAGAEDGVRGLPDETAQKTIFAGFAVGAHHPLERAALEGAAIGLADEAAGPAPV